LLYLTAKDCQESYFAARDWFDARAQPVDVAATADFALEERYQTVWRMLVDPELGNPEARIFPTVKAARLHLTPNEVAYFVHEHDKLQTEESESWEAETASVELKRIAALFGVDPSQTKDEIFAALEVIAADGN
jgi:hypothetical protein